MDLKNKVIVITGGSSGLGKSLALFFVKENSRVVVSSDDQENLKKQQ